MNEDGRDPVEEIVEHGSTMSDADTPPGPGASATRTPAQDAPAATPAPTRKRRRRRRKGRNRRRRRLEPAFVSGTSSEFLGRRPLPRAARSRSVVFLLGPPGVGKSAVARRLLEDPDALHLTGDSLQEALANQVRRRTWREDIRQSPTLILDGPSYLNRRPAVVRMLQTLLEERARDGLRTMVCEGPDRSSLATLVDAIPCEDRATIALRFPVGRGRRRYAACVCDELGLDRSHAAACDDLEPWTYATVGARLESVRDAERRDRRNRRRRALRLCEKAGVHKRYADRLMDLEPWDVDAATALLEQVKEELLRKRRRGRRRRKG